MDITWNGDWFYANKSHANIDRETVLALHRLGHRVQVTNIYDQQLFNPDNSDHQIINHLTQPLKSEPEHNIFKLPFAYLSKPNKTNCLLYSNGSYTVGKTEAQRIIDSNITHLWVPTPDCAEQIGKQLPIPVIGLGVDSGINPEIFNLNTHPYDYDLNKDTFRFIVACDGALTTPGRPYGGCRGTDIAIDAYVAQFSSADDVCLIVKAANNYQMINNYVDAALLSKKNPPKVIKDFGQDPQVIIASKWRAADCMLSPIRDCRWEACCLEALACGTQVIATNCGGPKMYGKYGVEFVDFTETPGDFFISMGDKPIGSNHWTEPSSTDFGIKMKEVFESRQYNEIKASQYVLKNWAWTNIAQKITNFFKALP